MPPRPTDVATTTFLLAAERELGLLRRQAESAAGAIAAAAPDRAADASGNLVLAELAGSLVTRSTEIAEECARLASLIERTIAVHSPAPEPERAERSEPVAEAEPQTPEPSAEAPPSAPAPEPQPPTTQPERAPWPLDEPPVPGSPPPAAAPAPEVSHVPEPEAPAEPPAEPPPPEAPAEPLPRVPSPLPEPVAPPDSGPPEEPADEGDDGGGDAPEETAELSDGVKLLVTQMAVAGATREEIERRLVADFAISDPGAVLSELFGAR